MSGTSAPYSRLAEVYDRWTAGVDHGRWAAFALDRAPGARRALDLCCGTGRLTAALHGRGVRVTGVDRSEEMLRHARAALPGVPFVVADLTDPGAVLPGGADLVTCSFDSVNHFLDGTAATLLRHAARALAPGGAVVLDVNSERKLREVFGDSHYGDDLGDFAYVWRNRLDVERRRVRFLITLFLVPEAGPVVRHTEEHVQRWFADGELAGCAAGAGLRVEAVLDDYTTTPAGPATLRETWVLRSAGGEGRA
jgi:SAM-dependent methyltransferase